MATSSDLIVTFLGIEVLSITSYVLVGYRVDTKSAEAAWKYFILGAFSTPPRSRQGAGGRRISDPGDGPGHLRAGAVSRPFGANSE